MSPRGNRLADEVRRAIRNSGATLSEIAAEAGIVESILSKFMAKKGGLTLTTLQALAGPLRLRLGASGRGLRRSGSKESPARWVIDYTNCELAHVPDLDRLLEPEQLAKLMAAWIGAMNGDSRRGIVELAARPDQLRDLKYCVYGNDPRPSPQLLEYERAKLSARLTQMGFKVLGFACHQPKGPGGCATYAMLVEAPGNATKKVMTCAWEAACMSSMMAFHKRRDLEPPLVPLDREQHAHWGRLWKEVAHDLDRINRNLDKITQDVDKALQGLKDMAPVGTSPKKAGSR